MKSLVALVSGRFRAYAIYVVVAAFRCRCRGDPSANANEDDKRADIARGAKRDDLIRLAITRGRASKCLHENSLPPSLSLSLSLSLSRCLALCSCSRAYSSSRERPLPIFEREHRRNGIEASHFSNCLLAGELDDRSRRRFPRQAQEAGSTLPNCNRDILYCHARFARVFSSSSWPRLATFLLRRASHRGRSIAAVDRPGRYLNIRDLMHPADTHTHTHTHTHTTCLARSDVQFYRTSAESRMIHY